MKKCEQRKIALKQVTVLEIMLLVTAMLNRLT